MLKKQYFFTAKFAFSTREKIKSSASFMEKVMMRINDVVEDATTATEDRESFVDALEFFHAEYVKNQANRRVQSLTDSHQTKITFKAFWSPIIENWCTCSVVLKNEKPTVIHNCEISIKNVLSGTYYNQDQAIPIPSDCVAATFLSKKCGFVTEDGKTVTHASVVWLIPKEKKIMCLNPTTKK